MAVYNSAAGLHQDDSDITIINASIIDENDDQQRLAHPQTSTEQPVHRSLARSRSNSSRQDYVLVDHNPQEHAQQLEEVLRHYICDLKQENQSQIDCDRQLVIRLMDLIRPAYPSNQQKMIDLDKIVSEIAALHDKRHVEQAEKIQQVNMEKHQLQQKILELESQSALLNNQINPTYSSVNQIMSLQEQEHWTEIEDDTKKLQEIVQSQQNQINEIVSLLSQTVIDATNAHGDVTQEEQTEEVPADATAPAPEPVPALTTTGTPTAGAITNLLKKIRTLAVGPSEPRPEAVPLINASPGASPTHSLSTLVDQTMKQREVPPTEEPVPPPVEPVATPEPHTPGIAQECPVCQKRFIVDNDDARLEMYDHLEQCLFAGDSSARAPRPAPEPEDYACPSCNRKYPPNDEKAYHQHLADCLNRD